MRTSNKVWLIGVGGKARAGKDTFSEYLADKLKAQGHSVEVIGMSDPLKEALLILDPIVFVPSHFLETLENDSFIRVSEIMEMLTEQGDEDPYTTVKTLSNVRTFLQKLGTDVGRNIIGEDTWIKAAEKKIQKNLNQEIITLVTGIRFQNELDMINRSKIVSPSQARSIYVNREGLSDIGSTHVSENSVNSQDFDIELNNNGTSEFFRLIDRLDIFS